jgi:ABC-type nitrate/sulfonate/bicarbonate transport system permease component
MISKRQKGIIIWHAAANMSCKSFASATRVLKDSAHFTADAKLLQLILAAARRILIGFNRKNNW